jgi:hypothetical protein
MLYGIALNFYYKNKAIYITFDGICNAIRNHFKGLEYKHRVLIKWNAITLITDLEILTVLITRLLKQDLDRLVKGIEPVEL